MKASNDYVTGIALSQFTYGAKSLGIDSEAMLANAGLDNSHLLPTARVPRSAYESLLRNLSQAHKNASFGVDIGGQLMPPLYGALTSLAMSCPTLGEALTYFSRYQGLATGNCGQLVYRRDKDHYTISMAMTHRNPIIRRHVSECVTTMICKLLRMITRQEQMVPIEIKLEHWPVSASSKDYFEHAVKCPVSWAADTYEIVLSKEVHNFPILGHGEQMLELAENLAQNQLEEIQARLTIVDKIEWHVKEMMQSGAPRREIVAERLQLSTRSLDRRLKEAGTNWQTLLDQIRRQLAIDYLSNPDFSIQDVAEKLGYTEIRTFQRKFKSWTGMTPTEYRVDMQAQNTSA